MSTLFVNNLNTASGSTITIPTGKQLIVTDEGAVRVPGTILHVIDVSGNTATTVTSTSNVRVGIEAAITPKASNSKIIVLCNATVRWGSGDTGFTALHRKIGSGSYSEIKQFSRHTMYRNFDTSGIKNLCERLKVVDPEYYNIVDLNNHRRLIRAIEVCKHTNKPFSSYLNGFDEKKYNHTSICLTLERDELYSKINKRVNNMVNMGLIEEAKDLYKYKNLNPLNTIGYKELFNHFDGLFKIDQAIEEIKKNSRRFAKKQFTWLNNNDEHIWLDSGIGVSENIKKLEKIVF